MICLFGLLGGGALDLLANVTRHEHLGENTNMLATALRMMLTRTWTWTWHTSLLARAPHRHVAMLHDHVTPACIYICKIYKNIQIINNAINNNIKRWPFRTFFFVWNVVYLFGLLGGHSTCWRMWRATSILEKIRTCWRLRRAWG